MKIVNRYYPRYSYNKIGICLLLKLQILAIL